MSNIINVAIADFSADHKQRYLSVIQKFSFCRVVDISSSDELFSHIKDMQLDLLLVNFKMITIYDMSRFNKLFKEKPHLRIILTALHQQPELLLSYFRMGINGFLTEKATAKQIKRTIQKVIKKGFCSHVLIQRLLIKYVKSDYQPFIEKQYNEVELKIIRLICEELSSAQISEILFLSKRTIEWHRQAIKKRMGVKTTAGIVKYALLNGLIKIE